MVATVSPGELLRKKEMGACSREWKAALCSTALARLAMQKKKAACRKPSTTASTTRAT